MKNLKLLMLCASVPVLVCCGPETEIPVELHTVHIENFSMLQEYFRYSPDKDIIISGHRGGMMEGYPENCIASCEKTLTMMPSFFEIDPRLTKDSVIVLMHDATLDRTTTGSGAVADYTYQELQQFFLKDRSGNVTEYKIPTLLEMLQWGRDKTVFNFDNKGIPWSVYVEKLRTEWKDFHNIMLSVRSLEEAKYYAENTDNVVICAEISDMGKFEAYRESGIPWDRLMAYVTLTMDPEKGAVYDSIRSRGVMCMTSIHPTADRIRPDSARVAAYLHELAVNPDIIETDYPALFTDLPLQRPSIK